MSLEHRLLLPSWVSTVFSLELRKAFSYRANFWIDFFGSVSVQLITAYFLWRAIFDYSGKSTLSGYSFYHILLYTILAKMWQRVNYGSDLGVCSREIYTGTLTRYIIYPVSLIGYKFTVFWAQSLIYLQYLLFGYLVYFVIFPIPPEVNISSASLVRAVLAMFFGGSIYFFTILCIDFVAFWAENVWSLLIMNRFVSSILGGAMVPLALFPDRVRSLLECLPFYYFTGFPIRVLLGEVSAHDWAVGMAWASFWTAFFWTMASIILSRGRYRYSGAGV